MENKKETLEKYRIEENMDTKSRVASGLIGLAIGTTSVESLLLKTLEVSSKMYNSMHANTDFNFYANLGQFCSIPDKLETMAGGAGILIGGALLTGSLISPKYEIYKKDLEELSKEDMGEKK